MSGVLRNTPRLVASAKHVANNNTKCIQLMGHMVNRLNISIKNLLTSNKSYNVCNYHYGRLKNTQGTTKLFQFRKFSTDFFKKSSRKDQRNSEQLWMDIQLFLLLFIFNPDILRWFGILDKKNEEASTEKISSLKIDKFNGSLDIDKHELKLKSNESDQTFIVQMIEKPTENLQKKNVNDIFDEKTRDLIMIAIMAQLVLYLMKVYR